MKSVLAPTKVLLVLVATCLSTQSFASIISGTANNTGAMFINQSGTPPATVGNNNFQTPDLYAFDELQNFELVSDLTVNLLPSSAAGQGTANAGTIAMGTSISSHYVFFDPRDSTSQIGTVLFDAPILGIITLTAQLSASDLLGNPAVTYLNPGLRGLESNDAASVTSLMNPNELTVDWRASTPGDYIRVITAASPVPVPAAFWLFGSALLATVGWSRRKGSSASA
ncbi:MAG: PEP-CTERM sorting domain-containing protein [Gammaproteobacteria bacterium]